MADAFDAITTDRPYRTAAPIADARLEIARSAGTQFDPEAAEAFTDIPLDVLTRIRDERLSLRLTSSLSHVVVYTPRDRDYFCVEPVSHEAVMQAFAENNERLRDLLFAAIPKIGPQPQDVCATALSGARA